MMLGIPSIIHKFLLCGYSPNEGDAMHSWIEKKKKCLKNRIVPNNDNNVPKQWTPIISLLRKGDLTYQTSLFRLIV